MNKVILLGNLTRDIEVKYSQNGTAVGKSGIAVNRRIKGQNGEFKDEAMFIDLTFWGRTAEIANQYFRKGSKILIDGRLVLDQWTAQDGSKKSKHTISVENINFVESKQSNSNVNGNIPEFIEENNYNSNSNYSQNRTNSYNTQETKQVPTTTPVSSQSRYTQQAQPTQNKYNTSPLQEINVDADVEDMDDRVPF
jgi:single-strand DNA-binding protein